jgi:putative transposase
VKNVGEPCAGEPHARIDVAAGGNQRQSGQHAPRGAGRLPPTLPRPRPSEVSAFIDERKTDFGVEPICRALGVSASAYYQRASGARSPRVVEDERLLSVIKATHEANYLAYGYRRMWKALRRAGENAPRCRVQRLMAASGIVGAKRRGKPWRTTKPDPEAQRPRDLVKRDFTAEAPNRLWVGDFSHVRCWEGIVYFAFVIDVFSRMIVGWQLAANMRRTLVLDALRMALGLRQPGADFELVAHTDAGSQYTSTDYTQVLTDHRVLASIGSVGDAYDNALAESFVDSYKTELIADRVWQTRTQLELATVEWVAWFNHRRLHEALGDIPPLEFEAIHRARQASIIANGSVAVLPARAADGLTTRRLDPVGADPGLQRLRPSENGPIDQPVSLRPRRRLVFDQRSPLVSPTR